MRPFDFVPVKSAAEAIELLEQYGAEDAHVLAGGTALILMMKQDLVQPRILVGLREISDLQGVRARPDGGIEVGALTTLRQAEYSPDVRRYSAALAQAFGDVATVRIRNQATVGGNLAHADPAQDPPPMLMALGAEVVVSGPRGDHSVPLSEFFVDYYEATLSGDEIVVAVRLPPPAPRARASYFKFLPRTQDDYATVAVGVWLDLDEEDTCVDLRIGLGAAAMTPLRATAVENALRGQRLTGSLIDDAAELVRDEVDPIDDIRGTVEYKREMARVWVARALRGLLNHAD